MDWWTGGPLLHHVVPSAARARSWVQTNEELSWLQKLRRAHARLCSRNIKVIAAARGGEQATGAAKLLPPYAGL